MVKITRDILPDDGIVTLDNGIYKIWFARNYPAYAQNTLILDNALATMGAGFPSAIMAKELYPELKKVTLATSDAILITHYAKEKFFNG